MTDKQYTKEEAEALREKVLTAAREAKEQDSMGDITLSKCEPKVYDIQEVYEEFNKSWEYATLDSTYVFKWLSDNGYKLIK